MIAAVEKVPRKGNYEHAHEQSYIGPDRQCLAPLASLPSALSLDICSFFHCNSFVLVLALVWIVRALMDMFWRPSQALLYLTLFPDRPAGPCLTMRSPATATAVSSKAVVQ